jgi:hypothetical protein
MVYVACRQYLYVDKRCRCSLDDDLADYLGDADRLSANRI